MIGQGRHVQQDVLMATARRMGVAVTDMAEAWGCDGVIYEHGGTRRVVFLGRIESSLSHTAFLLSEDKEISKQLLESVGVRAPKGAQFSLGETDDERAAVAALIEGAMSAGGRWVLKPRFGAYGQGVAMGLIRAEEALAHLESWTGGEADWVLEEEIAGEDVRIQAIARELVAACIRKPAFVIGDGRRDIAQLAAAHDAKVQANNPWNRCVVDDELKAMIARQGYGLGSVPPDGAEVRLKATANMAKGALAIDITDTLHASYADWVKRVGDVFDINFYSVDLVTSDLKGPADSHGRVLEVNAGPDWLHHTFSERRRHDMAEQILRFLFPSLQG